MCGLRMSFIDTRTDCFIVFCSEQTKSVSELETVPAVRTRKERHDVFRQNNIVIGSPNLFNGFIASAACSPNHNPLATSH